MKTILDVKNTYERYRIFWHMAWNLMAASESPVPDRRSDESGS